MTTTHLALALADIDPMQVTTVEDAQSGNWTGWNEAKAHRQALKQAAIDREIESKRYFVKSGHYRVDHHGNDEALGDWINAPLPPDIDPLTIEEVELVVASARRWFNADTAADKEPATAEPTLNGLPPLSGKSYQKLLSAYQAFPIEYPNYQTTTPKINDDVHVWLRDTFGCNDKEKHAFAAIIFESLGIK